jgi:hypothetical protein
MAVWSGKDSRISFLPTNVFVMCIKPIAQVAVFFSGYIHKENLKTKGAKVAFLRFSIARIRPNFKKALQISVHGSSR